MNHEILGAVQKASSTSTVCNLFLEGESEGRVVHIYGLFKTRQGKLMVACYQTGGPSKGPLPEFRNFSMEKCERIELIDERFIVNKQFNASSTSYYKWIFHI